MSTDTANGQRRTATTTPAPPGFMAFGDLPNQVMPLSWAEAMLRRLYSSDRTKFGNYLRDYVTKDMDGSDEATADV